MPTREPLIELGIFAQTPTGWSGKVGNVPPLPQRVAVSLVPQPRKHDTDPTHCAHFYHIHDVATGDLIGVLARSTPGMPHWTGRLRSMNVSATVYATPAKSDGLPRLVLNWRAARALIPFDINNPPPIEERRKRVGEGA